MSDYYTAARDGDERKLRTLIETSGKQYVDWNLGRDGMTPLGIASQRGHLACVQLLLESGAAVDFHDRRGNTPLLLATDMNREQVVSALIKAGANVNRQNTYGRTPLMIAAEYRYASIVKVLLESGAGEMMETIKDRDGENAMFYAEFGITMLLDTPNDNVKELFNEFIAKK